jgi:hypothetical protein
LNAGTILSITKQTVGTAPLLWNLTNTTTMSLAFASCTYFNQNISRTVDKWNVNKVTSVNGMFQGANTALIQLFNNGQLLTKSTSPLNWVFTAMPTFLNWRNNCRLHSLNIVTTPIIT